jgi:hypothetical protein
MNNIARRGGMEGGCICHGNRLRVRKEEGEGVIISRTLETGNISAEVKPFSTGQTCSSCTSLLSEQSYSAM